MLDPVVIRLQSRDREFESLPGHITFMDIGYEINSTAVLCPYTCSSRAVVSSCRKYVHSLLANRLSAYIATK